MKSSQEYVDDYMAIKHNYDLLGVKIHGIIEENLLLNKLKPHGLAYRIKHLIVLGEKSKLKAILIL